MSQRRIAAVQVGFFMVALWASAAVKGSIRIKVLDSETRSVSLDDSGVPKNCDALNYDAYCHSSKTAAVTNTLLVQEGNQPPFRIACTIDTKWSACMPLPKGETFQAQRGKHGLVVYYGDDKGRLRKQLYAYVAEAQGNPTQPVAAGQTQPSPVPVEKTEKAPAPSPAVAAGNARETVNCSFSSTPSGAEVTVDGQFVGSTPSAIGLAVGSHAVVVSMPGFAQWKRELTVSSGAELTVNAVLEKAQ